MLEVEATYENGVLKLDKPLPLEEHERVVVSIKPQSSRIAQSAGLVPWPTKDDPEAREYLLGPDNQAWGSS